MIHLSSTPMPGLAAGDGPSTAMSRGPVCSDQNDLLPSLTADAAVPTLPCPLPSTASVTANDDRAVTDTAAILLPRPLSVVAGNEARSPTNDNNNERC